MHGNYLTDEECQFVAQHGSLSIVYCPRTHAYFNHQPHPWQRLVGMGANVVIGTDSRASNPDLSVFAELQWLVANTTKPNRQAILKLATSNAARAMRLDGSTLAIGAIADFSCIGLPDRQGDAFDLLFDAASQPVELVG